MKPFLIFLAICLSPYSYSQIITLDPEFIEIHDENADLTNEVLTYQESTTITNESGEALNIKWIRFAEGCPEEWDHGVFDKNITYTPFTNTNIDPNNGWSFPLNIAPDEVVDAFGIYLLPRGIPGCCQIMLEVSTMEKPDSILSILTFDIKINDPDCSITNVSSIDQFQQITLHPNPTNDFFKIEGNTPIESLRLFDSNGQLVRDFNPNLNNEYFVGDLPKGVYFAQIEALNQRIFKVSVF